MSWPCGWTRSARRHARRAGRRGPSAHRGRSCGRTTRAGARPAWFHTVALNREHGLYTPGVARDPRSRVPFLPLSFAGEQVLDVGTFDGFYALLAEHRGAALVVDNEQYVAWVRARWGIDLQGGEGFATIADCSVRACSTAAATRSRSTVPRSASTLCLLRDPALGREPVGAAAGVWPRCWRRASPAGRDLRDRGRRPRRRAHDLGPAAGRRLRRRRVRLLGFGAGGLAAIAQLAGLGETRVDGTVVVDGHPRIMATLMRAKTLVD